MTVVSDGSWGLQVCLPVRYGGNLRGMCGNYDGDLYNDFSSRDGQGVIADRTGYNIIGNSWQEDKIDEKRYKQNSYMYLCPYSVKNMNFNMLLWPAKKDPIYLLFT